MERILYSHVNRGPLPWGLDGSFDDSVENAERDFGENLARYLLIAELTDESLRRIKKRALDDCQHAYEIFLDDRLVGVVKRWGWNGPEFRIEFYQ